MYSTIENDTPSHGRTVVWSHGDYRPNLFSFHENSSRAFSESSMSAEMAYKSSIIPPLSSPSFPDTYSPTSLSWWGMSHSGNTPPPHTRSLYATIPLPPLDEVEDTEEEPASRYMISTPIFPVLAPPTPSPSYHSTPVNSPPSQAPRLALISHNAGSMKLHPVLENFPSLSAPALSPLLDDPATIPQVHRLIVLVVSTGQAIVVVAPSRSHFNSSFVRVVDVLNAVAES